MSVSASSVTANEGTERTLSTPIAAAAIQSQPRSAAGAVVGYPLFALGCACLLSASLSWERLIPTWRVPGAATIAMISYSLYLSHKLTSNATQLVLAPERLTGIEGLVIYFASSIAVGALIWWLIEHPFLRLRDRLLRRRRSATSST